MRLYGKKVFTKILHGHLLIPRRSSYSLRKNTLRGHHYSRMKKLMVNDRLISFGKVCDKLVRICSFGGFVDFLIGGGRSSVSDILQD